MEKDREGVRDRSKRSVEDAENEKENEADPG